MQTAAERLRFAKERREAAREEYRQYQAVRNRVRGISAARRHETPEENRRRRLRMNQESSARTRHADGIYQRTLEEFVQLSEAEQQALAREAAARRAQRDALAAQVLELQDTLARVRAEHGEQTPDEAAVADEADDACSTERLLELTRHIPEFRMTPEQFAESLMGVPACPAL